MRMDDEAVTAAGSSRSGLAARGVSPGLRIAPALLAAVVAAAVWSGLRGGDEGGRHRPTVARAEARRPNLLVVSLDTTRADHLSAYGYERPTTPRLEALLPSSVLFEAAYTPMPSTMPAHCSLFTSLFPRTHGVRKNGVPLTAAAPTLAEVLSAAGWRTAGFASSFVLHRKFGIARGFADWDDEFAGLACKGWTAGDGDDESFCRRGAATRERAVAWLEANGWLDPARSPGAPFFLFLHLFDAHNPYAPPPEHARLFPPEGDPPSDLDREIAAYDGEIHYADAQLGALLDRLEGARLLDDTLLVVVGDHGEGLMQHGWMTHGMMIYEEAVRVPLVVRWPVRIPGGRRIAEPVEMVDLAPTILGLLGVADALPGRQGRDLAPALLGRTALDPQAPVFLQRRTYKRQRLRGTFEVAGEKFGLRSGRWKYLEAPDEGTRELYDLERDPAELSSLAAERPEEVARLSDSLAAWRERTPEGRPGEVAPDDVSRLRALGYVP